MDGGGGGGGDGGVGFWRILRGREGYRFLRSLVFDRSFLKRGKGVRGMCVSLHETSL